VTQLKSRKKRSTSSRRWLVRQLKDPYVHAAQAQGYRSRAAFKLLELDTKFRFFKKGQVVVDLGAAPGGWSQVAVQRVGEGAAGTPPRVVGIDLLPLKALAGAVFIQGDFLEEEGLGFLFEALKPHGGQADVVLCDMAPATCGHKGTDHMRIMGMIETALDFAQEILKPGGVFVAKTLQGGTEKELLAVLKRTFQKIVHAKPPASRKESSELYFVATGFRGEDTDAPPSVFGC
jgi:23S rRNA (uridine2552-2'-O)-methyltransferase